MDSAAEGVAVETEAGDSAVAPKRNPVRKPLPAGLSRIRQVYEPPSKSATVPAVAR